MLSAGHIILRGWCENPNVSTDSGKFSPDPKKSLSALKPKLKQHGNHMKKANKKDNKMILWFEVDDTGCGMILCFLKSTNYMYCKGKLFQFEEACTNLSSMVCRNWSKQMGICVWELWASWSFNNSDVSNLSKIRSL